MFLFRIQLINHPELFNKRINCRYACALVCTLHCVCFSDRRIRITNPFPDKGRARIDCFARFILGYLLSQVVSSCVAFGDIGHVICHGGYQVHCRICKVCISSKSLASFNDLIWTLAKLLATYSSWLVYWAFLLMI